MRDKKLTYTLYLRDLKPEMQQEYINQWGADKNQKYLDALESGNDICVGATYMDYNALEIV